MLAREFEPQNPAWFKNGDFRNHILNEKNIPLSIPFINDIFKKYNLDHEVENIDNFKIAFSHVSYCYKNSYVISDKVANILKKIPPIDDKDIPNTIPFVDIAYEKLEFRGDGIAHSILTEYLCDRYYDKNEGFWTKLRAKIEKRETFGKLGKILGLPKYALIARNMEYDNARENSIALAEDLFEAFLGALSLEITYTNLKNFLITIIEKELDLTELIVENDNYKDILMHTCHKMKLGDPKYKQISTDTKKHIVQVFDKDGKLLGTGEGNTKIQAEQNSAKHALSLIVVDEVDDSDDLYGVM